jgi:hypothetical protein
MSVLVLVLIDAGYAGLGDGPVSSLAIYLLSLDGVPVFIEPQARDS